VRRVRPEKDLPIEKACIGGQTREINRASSTPLKKQQIASGKAAMRATGKPFAAGSSRAAVETTQNHVPMPGVLSTDARVHDHVGTMA
jgi:hypothetical protein